MQKFQKFPKKRAYFSKISNIISFNKHLFGVISSKVMVMLRKTSVMNILHGHHTHHFRLKPNDSFTNKWYGWQMWHNHFVAIAIGNDQKNVLHIDRDYKWCFGYCCKFSFHLYSSIDQINSVCFAFLIYWFCLKIGTISV